MKPITPDEVRKELPDEVVEIFNDLIKQNWNGHEAVVKQTEALTAITRRLEIEASEVFKRRLLDVEQAFREAGWKVEYDKPGWDETYDAFFRFSKP